MISRMLLLLLFLCILSNLTIQLNAQSLEVTSTNKSSSTTNPTRRPRKPWYRRTISPSKTSEPTMLPSNESTSTKPSFRPTTPLTTTSKPRLSIHITVAPSKVSSTNPSQPMRIFTKKPISKPTFNPTIAPFNYMAPINSSKRGVVGNFAAGNLSEINAAWYYTYGPSNMPHLRQYNAQYVGMVFCKTSPIPNPPPEYLLGFNEPERVVNMHPCKRTALSPNDVLAFWPMMEASNATYLGSPAILPGPIFLWMSVFLAGVNNYKPKVDFLTVHWYGFDAHAFLSFIDKCWHLFGLPIWVTEFSAQDYDSSSSIAPCRGSNQDNIYFRNFLKIAIFGLESREYVHRYSWYSDTVKGARRCYSLWNKDGSLTVYGKMYAGIEEFGI